MDEHVRPGTAKQEAENRYDALGFAPYELGLAVEAFSGGADVAPETFAAFAKQEAEAHFPPGQGFNDYDRGLAIEARTAGTLWGHGENCAKCRGGSV